MMSRLWLGLLIALSGSENRLAASAAYITNCDGVSARAGRPVAVLRRGASRSFWVLIEHGYEDKAYAIADVRAHQVTYPVRVSGGGC